MRMRFRQLILHSPSLGFIFLSDLMLFELAGLLLCPCVLLLLPTTNAVTAPVCQGLRVSMAERERLTRGFVALGICSCVVPSKQETTLGTLL